MKTFLIVHRETMKVISHYQAEEKDDTSANRSYLQAEPICAHVELPAGVDVDVATAEMLGDEINIYADPAKLAEKAARQKEALITAAYNQMNADVYAEMKNVFGTEKSDSATAFLQTWKEMALDPGFFVSTDPAMDTAAKVQAYADAKITAAKAYSKWRVQRIEQFHQEKAAILAS